MFKYEKKTKKEKQEHLKETLNKIEQGVFDVFTDEKFKEYLDFCSTFHNYSLNNQLLISLQKPEATLCAGFKSWKDKGRYVKAGEKGIEILAPIKHKIQQEKTLLDNEGKKVLNENGEEITEKVESSYQSFMIVNVFDVSQTEGKEIPQPINPLKGTQIEAQIIKNSLYEICDIPISYKTPEEDINIKRGAKGYCTEFEIVIDSSGSDIQQAKTLIHEYAHHYLDHVHKHKEISKNQREIEAESLAYVISNHFGIDTSEYSFTYISSYAQGKESDDLKNILTNIQKSANDIIDKIQPVFEYKLEHYIKNEKVELSNKDIELLTNLTVQNINDFIKNSTGLNEESRVYINNLNSVSKLIEYKHFVQDSVVDVDNKNNILNNLDILQENKLNILAQEIDNFIKENVPDEYLELSKESDNLINTFREYLTNKEDTLSIKEYINAMPIEDIKTLNEMESLTKDLNFIVKDIQKSSNKDLYLLSQKIDDFYFINNAYEYQDIVGFDREQNINEIFDILHSEKDIKDIIENIKEFEDLDEDESKLQKEIISKCDSIINSSKNIEEPINKIKIQETKEIENSTRIQKKKSFKL